MRHLLFYWFWLSLLCSFAPGLAQTPIWSQFDNSPAGTTPRNDDIHFVDPLHGWAARATDGIYRTTNGGAMFTKVLSSAIPYPGTTLVAHFRSINFASPTRGWAGNLGPGSYDGSVTDTNLLYETFDGGLTWSPVADINASDMKGFCALQVLDAQHIYGAGRVRGPAHFARSVNGGASWTVTNLTAGGIMGGIMDVYFKDSLHGFLVGMDTNSFAGNCASLYRGTISRTTDGGLTWSNVLTTSITCSYFWKMSWPSPHVGYVTLQQNGSHDTVVFYKTVDGGASWSSNGIPLAMIGASSFFLQGIGFVSETEGWMGGSSTVAAPFNFIRTTDGGQTWSVAGYDNTQSINRIRFLNHSFGYASGRKLHVFRIPLAIAAPPTNQTVAAGNAAMFTVVAYGTLPVTYQWRFNGTNLPAATNSTLVISNVGANHIGNYSVVVSDYSGSLTSGIATLSVTGVPLPPTVLSPPQSMDAMIGDDVTFSVVATGSEPMAFHWQRNGTNLSGSVSNNGLNSTYFIANAQTNVAGGYAVVCSNAYGVVTSAVATLTFNTLFRDDFDAYTTPVILTQPALTNGYLVRFNAAAGPTDFLAIFGFDYSIVSYPTSMISAPRSVGGSTKGLFLQVNKDGNGQVAAVNLYPTGVAFAGNYAVKFDLWLNWTSLGSSSEHALIGINHSGQATNRIGLATSDGIFVAINADGNVSATATELRDYGVYHGAGPGNIPVLMTTGNATFGPTPPLGSQFDSSNPGFVNLFPPRTIVGWGTTTAGSPGLGWVRGEIRQINNLITFLLNDTAVAQFTNTYGFEAGTILIGHSDNFVSIGSFNCFAVFDNIRVERIVLTSVEILPSVVQANEFRFQLATEKYETYTVQWTTNLLAPTWQTLTNLLGDGQLQTVSAPWDFGVGQKYFRVTRP